MNMQQPVRILYIDDSAHDRALVRHALEIEHGSFGVTEAATRAEFEAQLAHGDFDLVLSDFNILGYDGLQVLDAVKATNPRLPVLIVTGTGSEEIAVEAMKRGAADYVIKTPSHIQRLPLTIQSVLARHHAEMLLARVSRARAMMAQCNQVLVRAIEEAQLLREMCRIVVEAGGYRMAWIGFAENDANKSVVPVAQAGIEEGYLAAMTMTWSDSERGPTGTAIRTGKAAVARHIRTNSDFAPWREEALKRGYGSSLALPLSSGNGVIGVLGIYAGEADAFDAEEVVLLEELAADLGYGIGSLRARIAYLQAEASLRTSQARLAGILDIAEDAIIAVNENHRIILFNQGAERIFGYRSLEALGQPIDLLLPERFHQSHSRQIAEFAGSPEVARRMATRMDVYGRRKNGSEFPAEASISKFELDGGKVFTVILRDITERLRMERALRDDAELLRRLSRRLFEAEEMQRRRLARELHDRIGQNVTALSLNLNMLRGELPEDFRQKVKTRLDDCETLLFSTAKLVRDVMADLRPPGLDELGLVAALNEHARQVAGRVGFSVTINGTEVSPRLPPATEITLFRITQEALMNASKHARATEVSIGLEAGPDRVVLTIADNGCGFDTTARLAQPTSSLGMVSMRERAESIGARLRVESAPGQGTRVIVEAPRANHNASGQPHLPGIEPAHDLGTWSPAKNNRKDEE